MSLLLVVALLTSSIDFSDNSTLLRYSLFIVWSKHAACWFNVCCCFWFVLFKYMPLLSNCCFSGIFLKMSLLLKSKAKPSTITPKSSRPKKIVKVHHSECKSKTILADLCKNTTALNKLAFVVSYALSVLFSAPYRQSISTCAVSKQRFRNLNAFASFCFINAIAVQISRNFALLWALSFLFVMLVLTLNNFILISRLRHRMCLLFAIALWRYPTRPCEKKLACKLLPLDVLL